MATLFVSDLHLCNERPAKIELFYALAARARREMDAVYILGDLFEIWLGDDDDTPPHGEIMAALTELSQNDTDVYVMRGNRDFLLGSAFAQRTGATLLPDYFMTELYQHRALLTHGDLLCTRDVKYQQFRKFVRDETRQRAFLAQPLEQRRRLASETRDGTLASMLEKDLHIMDVEDDAVRATMRAHDANLLIHGHTHRPAIHDFTLDQTACRRVVLGDWYDEDFIVVATADDIDLLRATDYVGGG